MSARTTFIVVLTLLPLVLAVAWVLFVTVERFTLRSSGSAEPNSPEWLLLALLRWRIWHRAPRAAAGRVPAPEARRADRGLPSPVPSVPMDQPAVEG
jgi:hypothetical protein